MCSFFRDHELELRWRERLVGYVELPSGDTVLISIRIAPYEPLPQIDRTSTAVLPLLAATGTKTLGIVGITSPSGEALVLVEVRGVRLSSERQTNARRFCT
jgi:hypothetical protein